MVPGGCLRLEPSSAHLCTCTGWISKIIFQVLIESVKRTTFRPEMK